MMFKPHLGELDELYDDIPNASILSNSLARETTSSRTLPSGTVSYKNIFLEKATIVQADYTINQDFIIKNKLEVPCLEMSLSLSDTTVCSENEPKRKIVPNRHHHLLNLRSCKGFIALEENIDYRTFEIYFSADYLYQWYGSIKMLDQLIEKVHSGIASQLYHGILPITTPSQSIIKDIHQCPFTGTIRKIYLEAKVQELFALQLDLCECMKNIGQKTSSLTKYDIEKMHEAREYVRNHISTPCSIIELAHKIGTNDFKLKQGFKELFGTTIFGYLQEIRMTQARQHLQKYSTSINEIAELLGYQNQSAFTSAFKKYFGYPPSTLRK